MLLVLVGLNFIVYIIWLYYDGLIPHLSLGLKIKKTMKRPQLTNDGPYP